MRLISIQRFLPRLELELELTGKRTGSCSSACYPVCFILPTFKKPKDGNPHHHHHTHRDTQTAGSLLICCLTLHCTAPMAATDLHSPRITPSPKREGGIEQLDLEIAWLHLEKNKFNIFKKRKKQQSNVCSKITRFPIT